MKLKKFLALLLALMLAFSLAACGETGADDEEDGEKEVSDVLSPEEVAQQYVDIINGDISEDEMERLLHPVVWDTIQEEWDVDVSGGYDLLCEYMVECAEDMGQVSDPDAKKIAIINGHGEDELAEFKKFMKNNGFIVDYLNLITEPEISSDYQLIVICNPDRGYSESDITKIRKFLSNDEKEGKSMMVFADLDFCDLESDYLRPYLEQEWGIKLEDQCIYDPENSSYSLSETPSVYQVDYSEGAPEVLASGQYKLTLELNKSRPLTQLWPDGQNGVYLYSLLTTDGETSFSRERASTRDDLSSIRKTDGDTVGPFDVGVLALRSYYDNLDENATSVAVFGSDSLVNDYFISNIGGDCQATQEYMIRLVHFAVGGKNDFAEMTGTESTYNLPEEESEKDAENVRFGLFAVLGVLVVAILATAVLLVVISNKKYRAKSKL